jgi:hypothetical protein
MTAFIPSVYPTVSGTLAASAVKHGIGPKYEKIKNKRLAVTCRVYSGCAVEGMRLSPWGSRGADVIKLELA